MKTGGDDALAERREVVFVGVERPFWRTGRVTFSMLNAFIKTLAAG